MKVDHDDADTLQIGSKRSMQELSRIHWKRNLKVSILAISFNRQRQYSDLVLNLLETNKL